MSNDILMDCHNHSNLSPDGYNTPEEMVQRAVQLGIKYYALTDHVEINKFFDEEYLYEEPVFKSSIIVPQLIDKYKDSICISYGVELGQPLQDLKLTQRILDSYKYDYIIGSLHMCSGWEDFYYLDYSKVSADMLLKLYFDELLEMAKWNEFDILGHLTYPLRYIMGESKINIDMTQYLPVIKEIFKTIIKNDKGIEINTSGLRQQLGVPMPDASYIRLYYDLGGKLLTVGSDAHNTEDLGKGISKCIQIAREIGYKQLTFFKNRTPLFIDI